MRIQIAVYDKLVAEAIVEDYKTADDIWHEWCRLRYARNEPMGCANIGLGIRLWDVPVGSVIDKEAI